MEFELGEVLLSGDQISSGVGEIAHKINLEYANQWPVIVSLLVGGFVFCADLVRKLDIDCQIEFIRAKSYQGTNSTGNVAVLGLEAIQLENRSVLLVEDIIDTGLTLNAVIQKILEQNPKSVKIATLLDKPSRRKVDLKPDFACFTIPDHFVVGYGLDYDNRYRNLPDIHVMRKK